MKNFKRIASVVMVLMMMLSMMLPAMADNGKNDNTTGTIIINDAVIGQKYSAYQILILESFDNDSGSYAYRIPFDDSAVSDWADFVKQYSDYLAVDAQGYVTWIEKKLTCENDHTHGEACYKVNDTAEFARLAKAYAEDNQIEADKTVIADNAKIEFTDLNLGYYLIDTTLGTLCSLDTTNSSVEMFEKNEVPTIEKMVYEGTEKGMFNDACIGDAVNFEVTINAKKGADNYILHDNFLTDGFTPVDGDDDDALIDVKVMVNDKVVESTNYTVRESNCGKCDFEIVFAQTYLDKITSDTTITITYSAILNEKAELFGPEPNSNTNQAWLTYGDNDTSTAIWHTYTHTYQFDLIKTDSKNKLLDGAEFELYEFNGNTKALVNLVNDNGIYRVATSEESTTSGFESAPIVVTNGSARIAGLDSEKYALKETVTPAGYNSLASDVELVINVDDENAFGITMSTTVADKTTTGDLFATVEEDTYKVGGVQVINQSGTELPSTGGIGTTIFYCAGAILAVGAFVLLITKKRMGKEV